MSSRPAAALHFCRKDSAPRYRQKHAKGRKSVSLKQKYCAPAAGGHALIFAHSSRYICKIDTGTAKRRRTGTAIWGNLAQRAQQARDITPTGNREHGSPATLVRGGNATGADSSAFHIHL
ncbi:MAG: hypothetical protein KME26_25685 [Oscillatoria princeps RMCB-10]|nr:hypothetical protein [Oscillatoria princeps RMCB-10]